MYPQLILARLLFSLGGSAASTMVTAILPNVSIPSTSESQLRHHTTRSTGHTHAPSVASDLTITPANYSSVRGSRHKLSPTSGNGDSVSKVAGFVGMATGCGALIALSVFLPLPARFQHGGIDPGPALQYAYYVVGVIALLLAFICFIGLRGIQNEDDTRRREYSQSANVDTSILAKIRSGTDSLFNALMVGFRHKNIFIGYVGGFVARASSVGISLFIPLLVNSAFLSSGLCRPVSDLDHPAGLPDIKRRCPRAYVVAAELTGVSQFIALICAPLFGYVSSRISNKTIPLATAAVAGIIGYPLFALQFDAHDSNTSARVVAFLAVALIGISQIGAIVCSLSILTTGVLEQTKKGHALAATESTPTIQEASPEAAPLLESQNQPTSSDIRGSRLSSLKGSVAGVYSFYGGAGILILTKGGGALFDSTTTAAPFYMMASFNAILLVASIFVIFARS